MQKIWFLTVNIWSGLMYCYAQYFLSLANPPWLWGTNQKRDWQLEGAIAFTGENSDWTETIITPFSNSYLKKISQPSWIGSLDPHLAGTQHAAADLKTGSCRHMDWPDFKCTHLKHWKSTVEQNSDLDHHLAPELLQLTRKLVPADTWIGQTASAHHRESWNSIPRLVQLQRAPI